MLKSGVDEDNAKDQNDVEYVNCVVEAISGDAPGNFTSLHNAVSLLSQ